MNRNVAVMDCGSNSTRLLVTSPEGEQLRREMTITRLSEGVDASRILSESALERTRRVLSDYREMALSYGESEIVVVATSAVRDARNRDEFVSRARAASGGSVAVISGADEARYSFLGATATLLDDGRPPVVLDIGGGSTELALESEGRVWGYSTDLGCVRLSERVLGHGPVTPEAEEMARDLISEELARASEALTPLNTLRGRGRLVGLAGTVATLAQLVYRVSHYERAAVHHRTLTRDHVVEWRERLAALTPDERSRLVGMVPGREDVIVAGLLVLEGVMELLGVDDLISSEDDILDGVASDVRCGRRPVTMDE